MHFFPAHFLQPWKKLVKIHVEYRHEKCTFRHFFPFARECCCLKNLLFIRRFCDNKTRTDHKQIGIKIDRLNSRQYNEIILTKTKREKDKKKES